MYGKPAKWTALLKAFVQVASVRSQPGNNYRIILVVRRG